MSLANGQLIQKLKRLSTIIEERVERFSKRRWSNPVCVPVVSETSLASELGSLEGMTRVQERELGELRKKLARDCGPERLLALDKTIQRRHSECNETAKAIKQTEKRIRELQNRILEAANKPNTGEAQEDEAVKMLEWEQARAAAIELAAERQHESVRMVETKIVRATAALKNLEAVALPAYTAESQPGFYGQTADDERLRERLKERLRDRLRRVQDEHAAEIKVQEKEKVEMEALVASARARLKELRCESKVHAHMMRVGRREQRKLVRPVVRAPASAAEKGERDHSVRQGRIRRYMRMRLVRARPTEVVAEESIAENKTVDLSVPEPQQEAETRSPTAKGNDSSKCLAAEKD